MPFSTSDHSPQSPLTRWERVGIVLLLLAILGWGAMVELRGAFLQRRMTDACLFFRAGWVVRTGGPLYDFTEENGWHYIYPPPFALLMTPLADAPPGVDRTGLLPYSVSVGLWFALSVGFLALGLHSLASALEARSAEPKVRTQPWGCRRWWALRILPFLACLPAVGHTLMRGQTNLLLLALLCGTVSAALRGRSWRSGLCLAGAICLKVYPAFLLLVPLWRRDGKCLKACAIGLLVGLVVVPFAAFGPQRTVSYYERYANTMLLPALGLRSDQTLASELLDSKNNDSQSLQSAWHNSLHLNPYTRPPEPSLPVKLTALGVCGLLTLLTLLAAGRRPGSAPATVLFFGALLAVMLLVCPVSHTHYFCLLIPLIMGLLTSRWAQRKDLSMGAGLTLLLVLNGAVYILFSLPGLEVLRDVGLLAYPTLLLWLAATVKLWQLRRSAPPSLSELTSEVPGIAA
jgi:hypothetical protein